MNLGNRPIKEIMINKDQKELEVLYENLSNRLPVIKITALNSPLPWGNFSKPEWDAFLKNNPNIGTDSMLTFYEILKRHKLEYRKGGGKLPWNKKYSNLYLMVEGDDYFIISTSIDLEQVADNINVFASGGVKRLQSMSEVPALINSL